MLAKNWGEDIYIYEKWGEEMFTYIKARSEAPQKNEKWGWRKSFYDPCSALQ